MTKAISPIHNEREILAKVIRVSNSGLETDVRLTQIVGILAGAFSTDFCALYASGEDKDSFILKASTHHDHAETDSSDRARWEGLMGEVAGSRQPLFLTGDDQSHGSLALIPIADESSLFGVLLLYYGKARKFGEDEREFLLIVGREISGTFQNDQPSSPLDATRLAEDRNHQASQLIGNGMGFNRAMLFLADERRNCLTGMMGVGPDNAEEAGVIWRDLEGKRDGLSEILSSLSRNYSPKGTHLDERVRGITVPLDREECVLARTVREQKPFNVDYERDGIACPEECELQREFTCILGSKSHSYRFATVPLWGRDRTIGVIVVDNLFSGRPITEDDIQLLTMFTRQAGLAIENCILYKYLEDAHLELKKAQDTLLQREKLAALGEMAANVAHEIRNPLVSIGAFTRRLYKDLDNGLYEKRYAEAIIREVDRLEGILNDVLSFSKASKVVFEKFDLNRIIEETLLGMEDELKSRGIEVQKHLDGNLPEIPCDSQQMKQVFINLFSNSRDAMEGGGRVTVRTFPFSQDGRDHIGIEIRDTGGGIPSEVLHNIFNPFFTTKGWGTGLGLAICHRIVDGHRGVIEVDNEPDRGVTFTVKLPVETPANG